MFKNIIIGKSFDHFHPDFTVYRSNDNDYPLLMCDMCDSTSWDIMKTGHLQCSECGCYNKRRWFDPTEPFKHKE